MGFTLLLIGTFLLLAAMIWVKRSGETHGTHKLLFIIGGLLMIAVVADLVWFIFKG